MHVPGHGTLSFSHTFLSTCNKQFHSSHWRDSSIQSMILTGSFAKACLGDSLGPVGTVTRWKNKSTVELKCDNDRVFGLRVTSVQVVDRTQRAATKNNNEDDSPTTMRERSRCNPNHAGTQVDDEQPHESVADDESAETAACHLCPSQVPPRCETIIGRRVRVKDLITDRKKRNAIGSITRWKNKSTVEMKCEDNGNGAASLS